jgi:hypothetical protein
MPERWNLFGCKARGDQKYDYQTTISIKHREQIGQFTEHRFFFLVQTFETCCYREAARLRSKSHCGEIKFKPINENQATKASALSLRQTATEKLSNEFSCEIMV